jgi:hypothetical protein
MSFTITFKPPARVLREAAEYATEQMLLAQERNLTRIGEKWFAILIREAPSRRFAMKHTFNVIRSSKYISKLETKAPQPLSGWIEKGTKPHRIPKEGSKLLSFFWPGGPSGAGQYYFMHVHHPGTAPNPYLERTYTQLVPFIGEMASDTARVFKVKFTEKGQRG